METYVEKEGSMLTLSLEPTLSMGQVEENAKAMVAADILGTNLAGVGKAAEEMSPEEWKELESQAAETVAENWTEIMDYLAGRDLWTGTQLVPLVQVVEDLTGEKMEPEAAEKYYLEELAQTWEELLSEGLNPPEWD